MARFLEYSLACVILLLPEHKLFVGMLPKNVTDAEMTDLFSKYGNIKDLQILRGSQQTSKGKLSWFGLGMEHHRSHFIFFLTCLSTVDVAAGCAFLKYETKEQAVAAIEALNGTHKIEVRRNKGFQKNLFLNDDIISILLKTSHTPTLLLLTGLCSSVIYELNIIAFQKFQTKVAQYVCNLQISPISHTLDGTSNLHIVVMVLSYFPQHCSKKIWNSLLSLIEHNLID